MPLLRHHSSTLLALGIVLMPSLAYGANYTYNTTLDLTKGQTVNVFGLPAFRADVPAGAPTFDLAAGDTISGIVRFADQLGPQTLSLGFSAVPTFSFNFLPVNFGPYIVGTSNIILLEPSGNYSAAYPSNFESQPNLLAPVSIVGSSPNRETSFKGFTYSITINRFERDIGAGSYQYRPAYLLAQAAPFGRITVTTSAPEPGSLALLLPGVTAVWAHIRRRKLSGRR